MYLYHYALTTGRKVIGGSLEATIKIKTNNEYADLVGEIERINKLEGKNFCLVL